MNNFKKLIFTFSFIITLFLLASCGNDKVESFMVKYRDDIQKEIYEEEEIDLDWFELVVTYTNGKVKTFRDHEYYLIKHNYSANGLFDHKNDDLDEIVFDLVFEYDKYQSNEVPLLVKKDKVQEVSIVEIGKTEYLYGEMIDVSDFKLFIKYFNKPYEIIALTTEMLDLESGIIAPTELGVFEVDIWFNGVRANTPLSLIVAKNKQTLNKKDVKALYLGDKTIQMNEIEGAHYKFYPKGNNSEDYQWVLNNVFESNEPILTDYIVEVKYPETAYLEESNIVITELDYLSIQLQPHLVTKSETSISFKAIAGYDVIMVDHRNLDVTNPLNVVKEGEFITFNKLLPNHEYRFALRVTGKDVVYESQVLKEAVRTKPANSPIIFKENQTQAFTSESLNYLYTVKPTYKVEGVIFEVNYLQNGVRVEPLNVGVYQVELTTNLNDLVVKGTLTIVPKIVYANILNETKIYGDDDPLFDYEIKEIDKDFLSASFTRTEGEEVGNYQINGEIASSNPNYKVIVRPATLNIKKRTINLAINDSEGIYGSSDSEFTYELTNDSGDNITNEYSSELEIHLSRNSGLNVGDYQIKLSSYNGSNINLTVSNYGTYKIKPHQLRVYANSLTAIYGDSISKTDYLVNLDDLQYSDTKEVISGELSFKNFNGDVNTYVIEKGTLKVNSNYELIYEGNYLTVNPKEITLEYDGVFRYEYGHNDLANITASANVPLLAGEVINLSNLDAKAAGTYITEAFIKDQDNRDITFNYSITNKTTSFVITKKELVVTVNNTSRLYGTDNNTVVFTASVTGFVPGEENVNDLGFENNLKLTYETTATIESTKGSYLVWINDGFTSSNYSFKYVSGILEVLARPFDIYADNLVVTYNNENVSYGLLENNVYIKDFNTNELIEGLTLNVSYKQNNISVTPKEVGEYVVVISFAGNDEYEETQKEVALTINKKAVTVTYTNSVGLVYNGTDQEVLVSFAGLVDSFEPLVLNNVNRDAGNYTITVNGGNNYNITNPTHDYTIAKKTLTVTQLGSYTYNGYSQTISLDVTGKVSDNLVIGDINLKDARSNEAYTLVYSGSDQANYILPETVLITIDKANLTITPNANQSKVYDGLAESNLTYTTNILGTDTISLVLEVTSKAADIHPIVIKDGSLEYNSTNYNNPSLDIETFEIFKKAISTITQKGVYTYNMFEQTIEFDVFDLIAGDELSVSLLGKNAGIYNESNFNVDGADKNNYQIIPTSLNYEIKKATATLKGNDDDVNGYPVYSKNYTNNIKEFNITNDQFSVLFGDIDLRDNFNYIFGKTVLDLTNGGTTYLVDLKLKNKDNNFEDIITQVVFKFKSVAVRNNSTANLAVNDLTYYTIEDAIKMATTSQQILIIYNTSFSKLDVAEAVYNYNEASGYNLLGKIVLSYLKGDNYQVSWENDENRAPEYTPGEDPDNNPNIKDPQTKLILSEKINIYANNSSEIFINALRSTALNPVQNNDGIHKALGNAFGYINRDNYGVLELEKNSSIIFKEGSKFINYGFSIGEGKMYAKSGSIIDEYLVLFGYTGATQVTNIQEHVTPISYFAPLSINNEVIFDRGSTYSVYTYVIVSGGYQEAVGTIVGLTDNSLINIHGGTLTKSVVNGRVILKVENGLFDIIDGFEIDNPNISLNVKDKFTPLGGIYDLIVDNSTLNLKSKIMLISGSTIDIKNNSTINIEKELYIDTIDEYYGYSNNGSSFLSGGTGQNFLHNIGSDNIARVFYDKDFRFNPKAFKAPDIAKIDSTSTMHLTTDSSKIAGHLTQDFISKVEGIEVRQDGSFVYVEQQVVASKFKINGDKNDSSYNISKYKTPSPLFEGNTSFAVRRHFHGNGSLTNNSSLVTDFLVRLTIYGDQSIDLGNVTEFNARNVLIYNPASSPFLYSEDEDGEVYFEHQPLPFKLVRTVEGTSYGTLRLLQDQDGVYYIQIVEEGTSTTVLDNIQLYAIDYIDDGSVLDFFFDITGNPHTIRQKLRPISFKDQYGNDYLDKVLDKDNNSALIQNNDVLSYFEAVFNRVGSERYAKLMFSARLSDNPHQLFVQIFNSINAKQNMWWLDQALINDPLAKLAVDNIFNSLKMQVQVWNGNYWVTQAYVEPTPYLMEQYLVYIDLDGITDDQVKVRFVFATLGELEFDDVSIDFTENLEMIVHELDLVSAMMNGEVDVINKLLTNNEHIELQYKDGIRLGFEAPELEEGYSRGFGVKTTGYIYAQNAVVYDELLEMMEDKSFAEIKQIIIDSGREDLIADIPIIDNFYNLVLYMGLQETQEALLLIMFDLVNSLQ